MVNFAKIVGFPTKLFGATDDQEWHLRLLQYGEQTFYPRIAQLYDLYCDEFESWEDFSVQQNRIIRKAGQKLAGAPALKQFKKMGMGRFIATPDLPTGDIYSEANENGVYLSVDIRQANVVILTHYAKGVFAPYKTYEEWLGQFTKSEFIKGLKEMRLEILKRSGSWRQGQLQQHLMNGFYEEIHRNLPEIAKHAISINRDELIFDITENPIELKNAIEDCILTSRSPIAKNLGVEAFRVIPAGETGGVFRVGERGTKLKKMQPMYIPAILSLAANDGKADNGLTLDVPLGDGTKDTVTIEHEAFFLLHERIPVEIVKKAAFVSTILGDHPWSWYREQLNKAMI